MMVIYDGDRLFWSNWLGWTGLGSADRFTTDEARELRLPMAETRPREVCANSAQWIAESDARIIEHRNRET